VKPAKTRRAIDAIEQARNHRPATLRELERWVLAFTGVRLPRHSVCLGHSAPLDMFARQVLERPALALWHGPRGSGKSFLSAIDTHLASRFHPFHETRILGGSLSQSEQIHQALREAVLHGRGPMGESDAGCIAKLLKNEVHYHNGSMVSILAASATSVRGPHVPSLKLDEVDEIDPDIRESAMGMAMEKRGCRSSVLMTSTWHRVAGPMAELIDKGRAGAFPVDTYCVFEVLERCPEERSGPRLENCPQCPLMSWCHSDRDAHPSGLPKAKRSAGHYTIDSLIQKVKAVSSRVFESDYLCLRPRAAGVWFTMFDESTHVREDADFRSGWPVHLAIDPGVSTGAVWFQKIPRIDGRGHKVNVFADYYAEGLSAESNARAIMEHSRRVCGNATDRLRVSMDSAGGARTPVGPTVRGEFERVGCQGKTGLESWPSSPKADGLQLLEALLKSADGSVSLTIHPRCRQLIVALQSYTRAKRAHQWMDYPKDPQHPHEDLVDPLCGGLRLEFPNGRAPEPRLRTVHASRLS
jgi:hypothetical protein